MFTLLSNGVFQVANTSLRLVLPKFHIFKKGALPFGSPRKALSSLTPLVRENMSSPTPLFRETSFPRRAGWPTRPRTRRPTPF